MKCWNTQTQLTTGGALGCKNIGGVLTVSDGARLRVLGSVEGGARGIFVAAVGVCVLNAWRSRSEGQVMAWWSPRVKKGVGLAVDIGTGWAIE